MRFSIIIPTTLQDYPGAATDRENKFVVALQSAMAQIIPAEIIVISDGCALTSEIIKTQPRFKNIKLVELPKQPIWSGAVAQAGIDIATGEYIIRLDSDDFYGPDHLYFVDYLLKQQKDPDVGYYDVWKYQGVDENNPLAANKKQEIIATKLEKDHIGNGMFTYKRSLNIPYGDIEGYGHDWVFIQRIMQKTKSIKRLEGLTKGDRLKYVDVEMQRSGVPLFPQYFVCHIPGHFDH